MGGLCLCELLFTVLVLVFDALYCMLVWLFSCVWCGFASSAFVVCWCLVTDVHFLC